MGKTGSTLVAILAGAAVGAVAGVLLAPDQGEKTRNRISKGFKEGKDDMSCKLDDLKKQVKSLIASKSNNLESSIDQFVSTTEAKSEDVISALEKKLAQLKSSTKDVANQVKDQVKTELK
ncbi:MAG TPA: YtxH domain-containing protein [Flavobacterium sp.]|nr:YtxH domain-containing protein [Flavobacterium sp.]